MKFQNNTTVKSKIEPGGVICLSTTTRINDIVTSHTVKVMRTEDQLVREALIKMGWKPPPVPDEKPAAGNQVQPSHPRKGAHQ